MSDNADAGTADAGTQPTASDTSPSTGSAEAPTQTSQGQVDSQPQSSTPTPTQAEGEAQASDPTGSQKPANPWDSPENPYLKRFNDTQSHAGRLYQEKQQLAKQYQDTQERLARYEKAEQERAAAAKASPFQKAHPEYAQNRDRLNRVSSFRAALSAIDNADEATAQKLARSMGITADDLKMEREAAHYRERITEEFNADPEGFVQSRVESKIQEALGRFDEYLNSRSTVERIINDPSNAQLIQSYAPQMSQMMDPQVPARDKAFAFAQLMAERDALKAKLGKQVEQDAQAEAQSAMSRPRSNSQGVPGRSGKSRASEYPAEAQRDPIAWLKSRNPKMNQDALITEAMKINDYFNR